MPKAGFINSDGVKLQTLDWGGEGSPLVLLAGLGDTAMTFNGLAPKLASRYRVLGLTRRGHGRSERPDFGYDLDTFVEDIRRFLDALEIERPVLVGHSFAGLEMPRFAVRYPQRVAAIVYLDAIYPKLDPEPDLSGDPVWAALPGAPSEADYASPEAFLANYKRAYPNLARIWCPAVKANRLEDITILGDGRVEDHHDDELMNRIFQGYLSRDPEYSQVEAPMLALVPAGGFHPIVPLDATDELRREADRFWSEVQMPWIYQRTETFRQAAPEAQIVELDTPYHRIFIAEEEQTLAAIFDFLGDLGL